jgi:quercetin 2,3-dioxygenase
MFVYILEGAFEVQYRLMEKGDGLALLNTRNMEIEALSNDAIILILDMGYDTMDSPF